VRAVEYLKDAEGASGSAPVRIKLLPREKGEGANAGVYAELTAAIAAAGGAGAGGFPGDAEKESGALRDEFAAALAGAGLAVVDATRGVEAHLAVKDEDAMVGLRKAGHLAARVARDAFQTGGLENVLEDGNSGGKSNADMAADVERVLEGLDKYKVPPADQPEVDFTAGPLVQSGGAYNTQVTTPGLASDGARFSDDVIIFASAMRYKHQTALVGRTYIIDASPSQLAVYDALLEAEAALIDRLRPGAVIGEAVTAVRDSFLGREGVPTTALLSKNFGSGTGLRLGDRHCVLSSKSGVVVEAGMTFAVCMALYDIPLTDAAPGAAKTMGKISKYAVLLADTVVVTDDGPVVVTDKASKERKDVVYTLAGDDEGEEGETGDENDEDDAAARKRKADKAAKRAAAAAALDGGRVGGRSTRLAAKAENGGAVTEEAIRKREEHQKQLMAKQREAALKRRSGGEGDGADGAADDEDEAAAAAPIEAYESTAQYPRGIRQCALAVDKAHDCVLVPLFGTHGACVRRRAGGGGRAFANGGRRAAPHSRARVSHSLLCPALSLPTPLPPPQCPSTSPPSSPSPSRRRATSRSCG
jgi:nucleosome binding factor SPN SPT16 subunit